MPGIIGFLGKTLGDAGVNIATFHLGRAGPGGDAIALISVDEAIPRGGAGAIRGRRGREPGRAAGVLSVPGG